MGIDESGSGSRDCEKGSILVIYGGIGLSNGIGLQSNHERGNQPRDVGVTLGDWKKEIFNYRRGWNVTWLE